MYDLLDPRKLDEHGVAFRNCPDGRRLGRFDRSRPGRARKGQKLEWDAVDIDVLGLPEVVVARAPQAATDHLLT